MPRCMSRPSPHAGAARCALMVEPPVDGGCRGLCQDLPAGHWPLAGAPRASSLCLSLPGATCEVVLAPCAPGPCRNGGECRESEDYESFSCAAPRAGRVSPGVGGHREAWRGLGAMGWQGESRGHWYWVEGELREASGATDRVSPEGWEWGKLGEARGPRAGRVSPGGWGGKLREARGLGWQGRPGGMGWGSSERLGGPRAGRVSQRSRGRVGRVRGFRRLLLVSPVLGDEPVGCRVLPGLKVCLLLGPKSGGSPLETPSLDTPRGSPCGGRACSGGQCPVGWLSQRLPRPLPQGRPARSTSRGA